MKKTIEDASIKREDDDDSDSSSSEEDDKHTKPVATKPAPTQKSTERTTTARATQKEAPQTKAPTTRTTRRSKLYATFSWSVAKKSDELNKGFRKATDQLLYLV